MIALPKKREKKKDRKCGEGGYRRRRGDRVSFPDLQSSTRGQLERSTSSGDPHETNFKQLRKRITGPEAFEVRFTALASPTPAQLTLELYHYRSSGGFVTARR